ncbi:MAG TPA: MFS transporter [Gemmataceae bacterium]|nr:MFS transporter [Gemmataceae bacterium]
MNDNPPEPRISNFGKWMALTAALLGWLFDGLEMGLFPLIQKDALDELVGADQRTLWMGIMTSFFLVGAATGGVLFGWLGDRIGRVRSMMLSVLTYALVSGLCGFAADFSVGDVTVPGAWQIGFLRFIASLGMGGEWSLGVALINELWPDRSRAFLAGLIGAAANVGYLLIGLVGGGIQQGIHQVRELMLQLNLSENWVDHLISDQNRGWRLLMMLGAVPALLTFFIRWFVPESAKWEKERDKGATSHWATRDLTMVLVGACAACGVIMLWAIDIPLAARIGGSIVGFGIVTWGYTFPVISYLKRAQAALGTGGGEARAIRAGEPPLRSIAATTVSWQPMVRRMLLAATLSGVALLGTWGTIQQAPAWSLTLRDTVPTANAQTQVLAAIGAIIGTIAAALIGGWAGRRITYFFLCLGSFAIIQIFYKTSDSFDTKFLVLAFLTGAITASFYGWLPLYLPELFPTAIRATGQGFGYNFGRILAAIGVLQLNTLKEQFGGLPQACAALSFIYVVGVIVIWFVPETKGKPLPD